MQGNERAGFAQGLLRMLRPPDAATVAPSAIGRFAAPFLVAPAPSLVAPAPSFVAPASPETLGRLGPLEVRLAAGKRDIKRAQRLRYKVFYRDGHAIADAATLLTRRDKDAFDTVCDHLMVIDHSAPSLSGKQRVVGTYRLLRHATARRHGGFYSENEFDLSGLIDRHADLHFLELGRSCVRPEYRNKRTVELLWKGIWSYVREHRVDVMIGCASFDGTDPERLALPLSFLHHHARAPAAWRARAHPAGHVEMNRMAKNAIDAKAALRMLPPLIKGYLRLGAMIGDGAVVDHQFGTTDVLVVLPVAAIGARYTAHFNSPSFRGATRDSASEPRLGHDPEKWVPVFRKDHAQT